MRVTVFESKLLWVPLFLAWTLGAWGQTARFTDFSYKGRDARFEQDIDPAIQYFNPVLAGFYPDPSVCTDGESYFLVNSSFSFYPGVPIFKSSDMVGWRQIGHVLERETQLSLSGGDVSAGIFAPAISYNEANATFYMVTMNMTDYRVFYVKSQNPGEGWSDPLYQKRGGMDPSLFFDHDGRGYMVYTTRPSDGQKYEGDMAICMNELDVEADTLLNESVQLARGGVWLEGPHLYRHGDYYYLMCAEGGTGDNHKEVIFRSEDIRGPYEACPYNPILAQPSGGVGDFPVSSTGHADIIETTDGSWWAVFLACRPYEGDFYNTGRETFLLPVGWEDGWPMILPQGDALPTVCSKEGLEAAADRPTGNYSFSDSFEGGSLDMRWTRLRNPDPSRYRLDGNGLCIDAGESTIYQKESPTAVFFRQAHCCFTSSVTLDFAPVDGRDLAGMVLLQDETHNFVFGKTLVGDHEALVLSRSEGETEVLASVALDDGDPITLRVEGDGGSYSFSYKTGGEDWVTLAADVDATNLSTHVAGGFIGTMIGLYATTNQ